MGDNNALVPDAPQVSALAGLLEQGRAQPVALRAAARTLARTRLPDASSVVPLAQTMRVMQACVR